MSEFDFLGTKKKRKEPQKRGKKNIAMTDTKLIRRMQKIHSLQEAMPELPKPGEQRFFIIDSGVDTVSFLHYVLAEKLKVDEMVLVTYSVSIETSQFLKTELQNKVLGKLDLISTTSLRTRYKESYAILKSLEEFYNFRGLYIATHAKMALMKVGDDHFVLTGSGNFSRNGKIEQYNFSNDKALYDFVKSTIFEITDFERQSLGGGNGN